FSQVKNRGIVKCAAEVAAMAVRTVRQLGDPVLRQECKEAQDASAPEIRALVEDLSDTLAFWRKTTGYGRGIAAPQIGVLQRVIFLGLPGEDPWPLDNFWIHERLRVFAVPAAKEHAVDASEPPA